MRTKTFNLNYERQGKERMRLLRNVQATILYCEMAFREPLFHNIVLWLKLFVTECLIRLKITCGLGTDHFDAETYLSEREAFGSQIMCWRSPKTIDIYDQSRNGEPVFSTLAEYQKDLSQRRYDIRAVEALNFPPEQNVSPVIPQPVVPSMDQETPIIWGLDAETLNWVKSMEQQAKQ